MRYLRGLTRVSKRININIRSKDVGVTICPTGREIESSPFSQSCRRIRLDYIRRTRA